MSSSRYFGASGLYLVCSLGEAAKAGRLLGGWWQGGAEGVLQGMSLVAYEMHFDTRSIPASLLLFGLHCQ